MHTRPGSAEATPVRGGGAAGAIGLLILPSLLGLAGYAVTAALLRAGGAQGTPDTWANLWTTLAVYPLGLLAALWLARREGLNLAALVGYRRERLGRDLPWAVGIFLLALVINLIAGLAMNLVVYTAEQRAAFFEAMRSGTPLGERVAMPWWYSWFSLLLQPLGAGVVEELLYRGVALQLLLRWRGPVVAVLLTSLAYGLQHWAFTPLDWQFGLVRLVSLGLVGAAFAIIALRQGRLFPLIAGHMLWDVLLIGVPALLAQR